VTRDRMMIEMDAKYAMYGFKQHKGYGTAAHMAAIRQHGPCVEHRWSYAPVKHFPKLRREDAPVSTDTFT
jgi:ribonuclease HII